MIYYLQAILKSEYFYKMHIEKKLIQVFKVFVQRALIPQIKKHEGSLAEWNKFSSLISVQNINMSEIQLYVDSLIPQVQSLGTFDKQQQLLKKKQEANVNEQMFPFNPNKTFGGERNKFNMFSHGEEGQKRQNSRQESFRAKNINNGGFFGGLDKLLRFLEENQGIIEGMGKENGKEPTRTKSQMLVGGPINNQPHQKNYPS